MFGQFFDHGLDFIEKGGDGTKITIPLSIDDPLYVAPDMAHGIRGVTSITISRANVSGFDAAGNAQWINHTSPYIDQSQTYGSSDQVTQLLRKWVADSNGVYHASAELLDGATSLAWKNAFGETTNATLPTLNELRAHLLATGRDDLSWADVVSGMRNRDAAGHVTAGNSGQTLLLDLNPRFDTAHFSAATQTALHNLGIDPTNGAYALGGPPPTPTIGTIINFATFSPRAGYETIASQVLLESVGDHYIAGDGRVNENIALTTIHHVFHEEHNFQVRNIENAILAQDARAVELGDSSHSIAHNWQIVTSTQDANGNYLDTAGKIAWDGDKMFNAAKLTVEMEYQHTAVDQYARTITADLPEFVGYNTGIDATVSLDYAQVGFRFGHSTIRESIDLIDPTGGITGKVMSIALEQAFLNPALFSQKGAASIALGMTHQQMNEIDEFITPALNQGLLGQPLDLAAINIARGRDVGIPTLNAFRSALNLAAYTSWNDFGLNMIHPDNLLSFIAAYSFDGNLAKAQAIIGLDNGSIADGDLAAMGYTFETASAFLSGGDLGYSKIDSWLGGLAEAHVAGGLLGETFNIVFVDQIQRLMDGDRFYYLYRLQGLNMGDEIGNAQFKDIIERNTGLEHLNGSAFAYADQYVDLSQDAVVAANFKNEHKYGAQLAANPTLGIYSDGGISTNSNGIVTTVGGTQYIKDVRAVVASTATNHLTGAGLDGAPDSGANSSEVIIATDRNDFIYARAGDDTVYGEAGNDIIYGGAGIDRLYGGDGNDIIHGEDGGDLIDGGAGDDMLYGESSQSSAGGVDQIIGGAGNDTIYGGIGIDKLSGGMGDDVIFGQDDTDPFTHGGDGNDYIDGGTSGDLIYGDEGDDLLAGANDQDVIMGGNGDDILRPGAASLSAAGGGPDEVLGGDGKSDAGNDGKAAGFDMIDFSDYAASVNGVNANFATQSNPAVSVNGNTPFPAWFQIEGVIGSQNNDTVLADGNNNWLIGGSGNDMLTGNGGNDVIIGDGIRLDSLIGTYASSYTNTFDEATHRAVGFIQNNGLLGNANIGTAGFEKHYSEMLKSAIFKDLQLGASGTQALIGGGSTGDGGMAGASDTATFRGNHLDYVVEEFAFATANQGIITAYKITDKVAGRDGVDIVLGVENFKFADVTLTPVAAINVAPVIYSNGGGDTAAINVAENGVVVTTVAATDVNGNLLSYSITGGADAALFAINATTGALSFKTAPNFEAPTDAGANNVYDLIVQVSDGALVDTQTLAVTVTNVNEAPVITSNAGGATAAITIAENTTAVTAVTATDVDAANTLTYSVAGGLDAAKFAINASTGALSFIVAPNFEAPTDADPNNVYNVIVQVSDGALVDTQALAVTVTNVNEAATGALRISGYTANNNNATLTASNTLVDPDGMSNVVQYQWQRLVNGSWQNIAGATTATLANQNNTTVRVSSSYTDIFGNYSFISTETAVIARDNNNGNVLGTVGNDYVLGLGGSDVLTGNTGNDTVDGGAGNDTLMATVNDGNDVYIGGAGTDTFDLSLTTAGATINLALGVASSAQTGADTLSGIEDVFAGAGNDIITDNASANRLDGNNGNDTFVMTADNVRDDIRGGAGSDTIDYSALTSNLNVALDANNQVTINGSGANIDRMRDVENFTGGSGNDTIVGDLLANALKGGAGNDSITGGLGADVLSGGLGADRFIYTNINETGVTAATRDVITDFLSGTDRLDFSAIDANTGTGGNQAFTSLVQTTAAFTAAAQLHFHYEGVGANEVTVLQGNVNNNIAVDFEVVLLGHVTFAATDVIM